MSISVLGRFHAFDLARELHKRGKLESLITSFPKYAARDFQVPKHLIRSLPSVEVLRRVWLRSPPLLKRIFDARAIIRDKYDRAAAKHISPNCDIFVGWSGASLRSLQRAKELGATTILERGSCHIAVQDRILREEAERSACDIPLPSRQEIEQERLEYEQADFIAVPSAFAEESFIEQGFARERIVRIPFGVALQQFNIPKQARDPRRPFRILHVGAVSHQKGCHYLLRAFRELALPNSELHFVGRVDASMRTLLAREQAPNIFAHGTKAQSELPAAYHDASVFCLASVHEGLSMVLAQAMACGLPVIASANTGAAEFIEDGVDGFLFDARNQDQLKQHLLSLHAHPDQRNAIGERANTKIRSGFDWHDYGNRIDAVYSDLLSRSGKSNTGAHERQPEGTHTLAEQSALLPQPSKAAQATSNSKQHRTHSEGSQA